MKSICFYFQVHQPFRLRPYKFFDIGENHQYFDQIQNSWICKRVAEKCYLPTNKLILELINQHKGAFKVAYSISGTAIEQFEAYCPEVLESFQALAETGCVEFLCETYSHSLSSLASEKEFKEQVLIHKKMIEKHFNITPTTFRNTELIYSDNIGRMVKELGFKAQLAEGAKHILAWRSPNYLYQHAEKNGLLLLLKNYQLSDDIAFRFSQQDWSGYPLTCDKFVSWINNLHQAECINLFMDYETFGEHQWKETGIFDFLRHLPHTILTKSQYSFSTPKELITNLKPRDAVHAPQAYSWADEERDLTAWLGNDLQDDAFEQIYELEQTVLQTQDQDLIRTWRYLQTSDNFYYMCTKFFNDGDVHKYFNHYNSPYEAYINYMNVINDFRQRLKP
jgi:alpha-amylase